MAAIPKSNTNELPKTEVSPSKQPALAPPSKRPAPSLINERSASVTPQLGTPGHFCMEFFGGAGNLAYAMKHYFPDSFGVDHKIGNQRIKIVCLKS